MITKMVAATAIALGLSVLGAAPGNADPSHQSNPPGPNPFAGLTCECQPKPPFAVPFQPEIDRGLQAALAG
ncbi:hypothetical protein [Mycobacterium shigaense]|uniref:Uncharacterized protein n=1 Tax=Mycobacterium shigaense TaxID=722731 RepID=A0A1Z4EIJ9_9MYCO|nr:hypothetical protein [Mycobacterium shigaense]MEA1123537.1 hypothetical protein [Mycobacterium shigaense]PRI13679.1 hypothetical protein B2J96_18590 [Mycobacterium shigaense]BAX92794.1 hypothetical protein MSG_02650 [Mycobacterium shigaense]